MSVLEYTNQNTLTRYPFKDSATLAWGNMVLPNNLITDAQFTATGGYSIAPCLTSIAPGDGGVEITFVVVPTDLANTMVFYVPWPGGSFVASATAVDSTTYGRLEVDSQAIYDYYDQGFPDELDFVPADNMVCASTVRYTAPVISSLAFSNQDGSGMSFDGYGAAALMEGANVQFTGQDKLIMDVLAGAGTGLYDACKPLKDAIYRINNIAASATGGFNITGDSCYHITPVAHGVTISNSCKPECTEADLNAFAYYLNRVKDGVLDLAEYIKTVKGEYDALITKYQGLLTSLETAKPPYLLVEATTASNQVKDYHSVACAVYSPSSAAVQGTLAVDTGMFTLEPQSISVTQDGIKKMQDFLGFSRMMKRENVIFHNFVVSDAKVKGKSPNNVGDQAYDVQFNLSSVNAHAYFSLPLLATTPNFTVAYTTLNESGVRKINVTVDLLNRTGDTITSSLVMDYPTGFAMTSGSFIADHTVVTPLKSLFGFRDTAVNYGKKATCSLQISCANPALPYYDVPMSLLTSLGYTKKVIRFYV